MAAPGRGLPGRTGAAYTGANMASDGFSGSPRGSSGSGRAPAIKRSNALEFERYLDVFRDGTRAEVRARLPPDTLKALFEGARVGWVPVAHDGLYVDAVVDVLGREQARAAWRSFTAQMLTKTPLHRTIFEGAARLFGLDVGSFVRVIPLAYRQSFRDFAELEVEREPGRARVTMYDFAPEALAHPYYFDQFHGVFLGLFDLAKAEPDLDYRPDPDAGRLEAIFRW